MTFFSDDSRLHFSRPPPLCGDVFFLSHVPVVPPCFLFFAASFFSFFCPWALTACEGPNSVFFGVCGDNEPPPFWSHSFAKIERSLWFLASPSDFFYYNRLRSIISISPLSSFFLSFSDRPFTPSNTSLFSALALPLNASLPVRRYMFLSPTLLFRPCCHSFPDIARSSLDIGTQPKFQQGGTLFSRKFDASGRGLNDFSLVAVFPLSLYSDPFCLVLMTHVNGPRKYSFLSVPPKRSAAPSLHSHPFV